jgi:hypothetical protein
MRRFRACALGVRATLAAPRRIEGGLADLLASAPAPDLRGEPAVRELKLAFTAASAATRILSAIPGLPWRRTCLYRATTECIIRRSLGQRALLCLGARPGTSGGGVEAHAWVEVPGSAPATPRPERYTTFKRASAHAE